MNDERNHYSVPETQLGVDRVQSFGTQLAVALSLPIALAVGAWCLQWLLGFPPRSVGASLTAGALVLALVALIIPAPIAVAKLIRHPTLRSRRNLTLTIIASLLLLPGLVIVIALVSRS